MKQKAWYIRVAGEMLVVEAPTAWDALRKVFNSTTGVYRHAKAVQVKIDTGKRATISIKEMERMECAQ